MLARQLSNTRNSDLTDEQLLGATRLCEQYCNAVFALETLELYVWITPRTRYLPITYLRTPISSIAKVSYSNDDGETFVNELPNPGEYEPTGNLLPPPTGWPSGDLQIVYAGGYQTPAPNAEDGDGLVPPDLRRAVEVTARYVTTIDQSPNVPKDQYSDIQFTYSDPQRAIPQSVMTILQRYKRALL